MGNGNWETTGGEVYEEYCWFPEGYSVYTGMATTLYCRKTSIIILCLDIWCVWTVQLTLPFYDRGGAPNLRFSSGCSLNPHLELQPQLEQKDPNTSSTAVVCPQDVTAEYTVLKEGCSTDHRNGLSVRNIQTVIIVRNATARWPRHTTKNSQNDAFYDDSRST